MRVKICGLTRAEDALLAESLGAWALGFIFYAKSPRFIEPAAAKEIIARLQTPAIGVFVNQTAAALRIAAEVGLRGIQLHGDETLEEVKAARAVFNGFLIKAFRLKTEADLAAIADYKGLVDYILIDAAVDGHYGGSGLRADGSLASRAKEFGIPVILAGGLNAENAAAAIAAVQPYAIDLSSGVEATPRIKDHEKMKALFRAAGGLQ